MYPIKWLRPSRILLAPDYIDMAVGRSETFLEQNRIALEDVQFLPDMCDSVWTISKFLLTSVMNISNPLFLPDGGVIFTHQGQQWYAAAATCDIHPNLRPCFYCAKKVQAYI
jgi:hypothetical protein